MWFCPTSCPPSLPLLPLSQYRYVILTNKLPPTRFEAHLEIHAGSVDEGVDEQVRGLGV